MRVHSRLFAGLLPAVLLLAATTGCRKSASQGSLPEAVAEQPDGALGSEDVIEIRVFDEPELSGVFRIAEDGSIDFPLVGQVSLLGMTASEASGALETALTDYLKKPHVSVFVREYNSQKIFVFGEVNKPGTFRFTNGMNIVEAITLAGGFTNVADAKGAYVTRKVDGQEHKMRVSVRAIATGEESNVELQPGDIIYVPESVF